MTFPPPYARVYDRCEFRIVIIIGVNTKIPADK